MVDHVTESVFSMTDEPISDDGQTNLFSDESPPERLFPKETKAPKQLPVRATGENLLSYTAVIGGTVLVNKRIDPPVGRCLQLEAPLIGQKLDALIAGTFIDRLLQPLFSSSEKIEELGAILALPALVGMMERKPEWTEILMGPLSQSLGSVLEQAAPLMRKTKTKQRAAARDFSEINDAFDIPRGADPIEAILKGFIFQDVIMEEPIVEEPAPA